MCWEKKELKDRSKMEQGWKKGEGREREGETATGV